MVQNNTIAHLQKLISLPKHSCFKTKFISHIKSKCHQKDKDPSQLLWLISRNRPDVLNTLGTFAKITWMVRHNTMVYLKKLIPLPKQSTHVQN